MSKYCLNCGTKISKGVSFCGECGTSFIINSSQKDLEMEDDMLIQKNLRQPNKGRRISKILAGMAALVFLFLIGKSFLAEPEPIDKPFSMTEQLSKLEGTWHDPTGVLLGDKEAIIMFKKVGGKVIGKDENGFIEINIIPFGSNNYGGLVINGGITSDFSLHFYEEDNKLVFFSTFTKSSWYIKKIN